MQRHGIGRQLHPSQSGSTPHDHLTIPQICSSPSLPLDRPRQSAPRYPPVVASRPTIRQLRRHPPPIHQPLHRWPTRWIGSNPITHLTPRHSNPHSARRITLVPLCAVSSLGGFRTPAAELKAPSLMRPASEKRQGTKSREVGSGGAAGAMGILPRPRAREAGAERLRRTVLRQAWARASV